MLLDIDRFKRINDHYGHATGDQALRGLVEYCRSGSRAVDLICRYGGEEFVILLPETHIEAAKQVAERLRLSIMENPIATDSGPLRITVNAEMVTPNTESFQAVVWHLMVSDPRLQMMSNKWESSKK